VILVYYKIFSLDRDYPYNTARENVVQIGICRSTLRKRQDSSLNKHFEILVSCSDKEKNCMQAHETACKLM